MIKLLALVGLAFLAPTANAEANIKNVAIRISSGFDQFASCAASAALASAKIPEELNVLGSVEVLAGGPGPYLLAKLKFLTKSSSGSFRKYELTFKSTDEQAGFQLIRGTNGEIYPYTSEMESDAMLVSQPTGIAFGMFEVSKCKFN